jgi:hypothetical protein
MHKICTILKKTKTNAELKEHITVNFQVTNGLLCNKQNTVFKLSEGKSSAWVKIIQMGFSI